MISNVLQDKVFANLQIFKEIFLSEITILLVKQQIF